MKSTKKKEAVTAMTPVQLVLSLFGGSYQLARALDIIAHTTVSRWGMNNGGCVPSHHMQALLELAKQKGIKLTERDLIYGRPN